jgi:subtilisin family serine protease
LDKIGFDLLRLMEEREAERAEALARGEADAAGEIAGREMQVEVVFEGELSKLLEANFPLELIVPELACAYLTTEQIRNLAEVPTVRGLRRPAKIRPMLERGRAQIRAGYDDLDNLLPPERSYGNGVTIGIIDDGVFVNVQALRSQAVLSEIFRLWDQTFRFDAAGEPVNHDGVPLTGANEPHDETGARVTRALGRTPRAVGVHSDLDYGIDFDTSQINTALTALTGGGALPISLSGQISPDGLSHGTAVACVAAGRGRSLFGGLGIAGKARLIIVKSTFSTREVEDAIKYIVAAAPVGPVVINCSFGGHNTPHNGMDSLARLYDRVMTENSRLAIVTSAGNSRADNSHAALRIPSGLKHLLRFMIWGGSHHLEFFCSYNAGVKLTCRVGNGMAIDSGPHSVETGGEKTVHEHKIKIDPYAHAPSDPDRHFVIAIERLQKARLENGQWIIRLANIQTGLWTIELEVDPQSVMPTAFVHLWRSDPPQNKTATEFIPLPPEPTSPQDVARPESILGALQAHARQRRPESWIRGTLSGQASSRRAIVVAAYDAYQDPAALADFSAQGPDASNLMAGLYQDYPGKVTKPDIAAPGVSIAVPTVLLGPVLQEARVRGHGTSLAAPFVTGVVALMWAANPTLTNLQIKQLLLEAARGPLDPLLVDWLAHNPKARDELWGAGVLDAHEAVKRAMEHQ